MDGLAGGVAAIASAFLALNCLANGLMTEALLTGILAAALFGFLVYNSNPASIFMGDCGSMFIGFFLGGAALLEPVGGRSRSFLPVLAVPVLVLLIPIFDVCLVAVMRKLAGRSVSQGGRDHTSHRLVALGLSERRAVLLLYVFAVASGGVALLTRELPTVVCLLLITGFTLALTLLGIHIAAVKVYAEEDRPAESRRGLAAFLIDLSYKRRIFELLLDVVLIAVAYATANVLYFGAVEDDDLWALLASPLPLLVLLKLGAFLIMGVYRGMWRFISVSDLLVYAKAVGLGSVVSVLALLVLYRFNSFSRTVFFLDGLLLLLLVAGSRITFRLLRGLLPLPPLPGARRALIYGAGDAGEWLLREMQNNPNLGCIPVGFADDDPLKKGKVIHGLRVFGGNGTLPDICRVHHVEEVYISSARFSAERVREIVEACQETGVVLKRLRLSFETLAGTITDPEH
jgi:UDP-GlcNAc:undecaprenyl-phosphate GlcNAc-1-phosphate transferase